MRAIRVAVLAVLVVLPLVAPTVGHAQAASGEDGAWWEHGAAPASASSREEPLPDRVIRARSRLGDQLRRVQRSDADVVPRVILEMVAGYAGGVVGVLAGALFGSLACVPIGGSYEPDAWSCHGGRGAVMGVIASAFTASTMGGVYDALGGLPTVMGLAGAVSGAAGYLALGQTLAMIQPDPAIADDLGGGMLLALIPVITNVLALELADDGEADAIRRTAAVLPSLGVLRDGSGRVIGGLASLRVEL